MFAKVVWKATTKVGFGIKNNFVVAWYCEEQPAIGDVANYKKNILESCIQDNGVNKCFNVHSLEANNKKRDDHGTEALEWDEKAAAEAQKQLNQLKTDKKLDQVNIDKIVPTGDFKDCSQNVYTQDD